MAGVPAATKMMTTTRITITTSGMESGPQRAETTHGSEIVRVGNGLQQ